MKRRDQRIGIFVDVQNMYYSAKNLYLAKVDFGKVVEFATGDRKLIRAIAYVIKADVVEELNFFEALAKRGLEVKAKDLQVFYGGMKKGDWDVGIAMDILKLAPKLDVIALVSGDGDFTELLRYCKALGCQTEVYAFRKSSSSLLMEEADEFIDLGGMKDTILIPRSRKGRPSRLSQS